MMKTRIPTAQLELATNPAEADTVRRRIPTRKTPFGPPFFLRARLRPLADQAAAAGPLRPCDMWHRLAGMFAAASFSKFRKDLSQK